LAKWKKSDSNCLSPKGEFWNRLKRALDLSKNVSEPAKNDFGNSPLSFNPTRTIPKPSCPLVPYAAGGSNSMRLKKRSYIPITYSDLEEKLHEDSNTSSYLRIR
jgi:hypothetical protein